MAFDLNLLAKVSVSGNTNAPAVYSYFSPESTGPAVFAVGYFNTIKDLLRAGDLLLLTLPNLSGYIQGNATVKAVSPNVEIA